MNRPTAPTTITPFVPERLELEGEPTQLEWLKADLNYRLIRDRETLAVFAEKAVTHRFHLMDVFSDSVLEAAARVSVVEYVDRSIRLIEEGKVTAEEAIADIDAEARRRMEYGLNHNSTSDMANTGNRFLGKAWGSWNSQWSEGPSRKAFAEAFGVEA